MSLNNIVDFNTLNNRGSGKPIPVRVKFNGNDITEITGPAPFVDISTSFSRTAGNDRLEAVVRTITLTGKILRPPDPAETNNPNQCSRNLTPDGEGIQTLMSARSGLEGLFSCHRGSLDIDCSTGGGGPTLASFNGVTVTSINFNQTEDNWARSIDYVIELEHISIPSGMTAEDESVTERSDTWTIEQLEDIVYTKFTNSVIGRHEWQNPNRVPGASEGGPNSSMSYSLQVINVPQFRITRRVSAKGISSRTMTCKGVTPSGTGAITNAKRWVEKVLPLPFNASLRTGIYAGYVSMFDQLGQINTNVNIPTDGSRSATNIKQSNWLYNHTRSTNADIYNGTYEITDTWLGMPSGLPYIESYTVETSTGLDYIKTVTVAGNIQGLVTQNRDYMGGPVGVFPQGTGTKINVGNSLRLPEGGVNNIYDIDQPNTPGKVSNATNSKYNNAASGWIMDIKPYLYRRACLAVNQGNDRSTPYVNPATMDPPRRPNNPIFSKETLLSVIPVSTTEGHDPKKGTVSYSYQFSNKFNIISGTISENIVITDDLPAQVISEIPVPGRQLGPILDAAGYTAARKTVSIELVVMPPTGTNDMFMQQRGCPLYTGGFIYRTVTQLIEGVKPFGFADPSVFGQGWSKNRVGQVYRTADQDTWSPTQGRYTRTVTWTYQQCNNSRAILDH